MARTVVVVGGGFAGLTAAVALADAGWRVTALERRNGLGGRARSFVDPATGDVVDNGQHVFLACYEQTLRFLRRLGTLDRLVFQDRLEVAFAEAGRGVARLRCPRWPAPWHLAGGLLGLSSIPWRDKLAMRRVMRAARHSVSGGDDVGHLDRMTVEQWLTSLGQSARSRQAFWDPLGVAALNDDPAQTSALGFATVLATMFGAGWQGSRLGIASVGLSDLYATQAARVIEEAGGMIRLNTSVAAIEGDRGRATGVRLASGERLEADAYVCAVPPQDLGRLLPESFVAGDARLSHLRAFHSSPIVSINLWLDRTVTDEPFVGLIGTRVQWVFNRPRLIREQPTSHIALVISAAQAFVDQSNEVLVETALEDLHACLPQTRAAILQRAQVVREREATIRTPVGSAAWRPGPSTGWPNLVLAGDWTATGLPATIESAVMSGYAAADLVYHGKREGD